MKPCPFCKSADVRVCDDTDKHDFGYGFYWVQCFNEDCFARGPKTEKGEDAASKAWDTRSKAMTTKDQREELVPIGGPVRFDDCPVGLFMSAGGELCLMTEYMTERQRDGAFGKDAYIVASGEYFWGGTDNDKDRDALMVQPLAVAQREDAPQPVAWIYTRPDGKELLSNQPPDRVLALENYKVTPLYASPVPAAHPAPAAQARPWTVDGFKFPPLLIDLRLRENEVAILGTDGRNHVYVVTPSGKWIPNGDVLEDRAAPQPEQKEGES